MPQRVFGVDLGGTNIRTAIVVEDGVIQNRVHESTPNDGSADEIADAISRLLERATGTAGATAVGLALAAVTNPFKNRISRSPNLPQLDNYDLANEVESRTGLPVYLENDATAAAVGEHWLGAGMGFSDLLCVTLGTGVGGGLILNQRPYYGAEGNAGEVGHICLDENGPPCGCGSNGCLEQYASGTAIVRITKEALVRFPASELHSRLEFTAEDVQQAARSGDDAAKFAFSEAGRRLGTALAGLVNVLNLEAIIIAGGVANSWDLLVDATQAELRKRAFPQPAERVKIVRGTLGDDAGVLGAAKRAFSGKGFS
jgi:glucokinase